MSTRKLSLQIMGLTFALCLLAGCGRSAPAKPTMTSTPNPSPTPAATVEETGFITGKAHVMAPPTPPLVIYAVDAATGKWVSVETPETDGETAFTLEVPPGSYQVFAFPSGLGYSLDGRGLTPVTVAPGQTIPDITLSPPGPSDCGPMFGVPASPDGRYAEIVGATEECLASLSTPQPEEVEPPAPIESELIRIQFAAGDDSAQVFGSIPPGGINHYVLGAMADQEMTVSVDVFDDNPITLAIAGADGTILNQYDTDVTSWTGVLPSTQDYYIDILSRDDQATIDYALVVVIPAAGESSNQATGGDYEPVSLAVCQSIQEMANSALSTAFTMEAGTPFVDPLSGETGLGCTLTATGTGVNFVDPAKVTADLVSAFIGWTEQPMYQAGGPTGAATAVTRDMALMLIKADWVPAPGVECPSDRPIADCDLNPEQKSYTVQIDVAQYRAGFSLDGHWEDVATGFSLDLYQDWKNIYGRHLIVAQGGDKIDALDASINGSLQGQTANVQFKSSFTDDVGTAQITYVDVNTIVWKIVAPPDGEYYLPAEATLTRK